MEMTLKWKLHWSVGEWFLPTGTDLLTERADGSKSVLLYLSFGHGEWIIVLE